MITITAQENDNLDLICFRQYGETNGEIVAKAIENNPHILPNATIKKGTQIFLEEKIVQQTTNKKEIIQLWS